MFPIGIVPIHHPPPRTKRTASAKPQDRPGAFDPQSSKDELAVESIPSLAHRHGENLLVATQDSESTGLVEDQASRPYPYGDQRFDKPLPEVPPEQGISSSEAFPVSEIPVQNDLVPADGMVVDQEVSSYSKSTEFVDNYNAVPKSVAPSILSTVASLNASETSINKRAWLGARIRRRGLRKAKSSVFPRRNVSTITIQSSCERVKNFTRKDGPGANSSSRNLGQTLKGHLLNKSLTNFPRIRSHRASRSEADLFCGKTSESKPLPVRNPQESHNFISAAFSRRKSKEDVSNIPSPEPPSFRYKRLCPYKEIAGCGAKLKIQRGTSLLLTGVASKDSLIQNERDSISDPPSETQNNVQSSVLQHETTETSESPNGELTGISGPNESRTRLTIEEVEADARIRSRSGQTDSTPSGVPTVLDVPVSFDATELGRGQVQLDTHSAQLSPSGEADLAEPGSVDQENPSYDPEALIDSYNHSDHESDADPSSQTTAVKNCHTDSIPADLPVADGSTNDHNTAPAAFQDPQRLDVELASASSPNLTRDRPNETTTNSDIMNVENMSSMAGPTHETSEVSINMGAQLSDPGTLPTTTRTTSINREMPEDSQTAGLHPATTNMMALAPPVQHPVQQNARSAARTAVRERAYDSGFSGSVDQTVTPAYLRHPELTLRNSASFAARLLETSNSPGLSEDRRQLYAELASLFSDTVAVARFTQLAVIDAESAAEDARAAYNYSLAKVVAVREILEELT